MSLQNQISNLLKGMELLEKYALSGDMQPHEAYVLIKESGLDEHLSEITGRIKKTAIDSLMDNFIEQGKQSYKDSQYRYTVRRGATRYYFTDVEEHKKASLELKASEPYQKVKDVEQKYKTAFLMKQKNQIMVDEETGEVIDVSGVNVVYSPDTLSIKKL